MTGEPVLSLFDASAAAGAEAGAELSACGRYRYALWRRWDPATRPVLFVMLNPSTATDRLDDPTIRRCMGFARRWGAGGIHVCNLYPWRATDPRELAAAGPQVRGEWLDGVSVNDVAILSAARAAGRIIAAWGAKPGPYTATPDHVLALLEDCARGDDQPRRRVEALKVTKGGAPWHPLYVPGDVEPVPYPPAPGGYW